MSAKFGLIKEEKELREEISSLSTRQTSLSEKLDEAKASLQERERYFHNMPQAYEKARGEYRQASIQRAEAQKRFDDLFDATKDVVKARDEAHEEDDQVLKPLKRKMDRAQRAYDRAVVRRDQAKERSESAKSMEGYATLRALGDTLGSFGGDSDTRAVRNIQRTMSQHNLTSASDASAMRAQELDYAEEDVITASEDLEDAQDEYDRALKARIDSRRDIELQADKADVEMTRLMLAMAEADEAIAKAEATIDDLDEHKDNHGLLEDAYGNVKQTAENLQDVNDKLEEAHKRLALISGGAEKARKRRNIIIGIISAVVFIAVIVLGVILKPGSGQGQGQTEDTTSEAQTQSQGSSATSTTEDSESTPSGSQGTTESTSSNSQETTPSNDGSSHGASSGTPALIPYSTSSKSSRAEEDATIDKIEARYEKVDMLSEFGNFITMEFDMPTMKDRVAENIDVSARALEVTAAIQANTEYQGWYVITMDNLVGSDFTQGEVVAYLSLLGMKDSLTSFEENPSYQPYPNTIAEGGYVDSYGSPGSWTFTVDGSTVSIYIAPVG